MNLASKFGNEDKMLRKVKLIFIMLISLLMVSGCALKNPFAAKPYKETQFLMDTIIEITAYGSNAEQAVKSAFDVYRRYHNLTNNFDPASQVSQVNQFAGKSKVKVDPDLVKMVQYSNGMSDKLEGTFDVSIGALTALWGIGHKGDYIPTKDEINKVMPFVNYRAIEADSQANTLYLPKEGMLLDLGGIAKGYATDQAAEVLKSQGIQSALINAGGTVIVIGNKPDGKPWRIGVQDPRNNDGVAAKLALTDWISMETSGDYQRFFIKDNVRYAHILDPRTGVQPREVASVTIVGSDSSYGEVLGKALFVLGVDKGLALLKQFPGNEAIFVGLDGKITVSIGLEGKIER